MAVFVPLAFTGGLTGSLFREFALTLAGAVLISGVVALTITPMMAARLLRRDSNSRFQRIVDSSFYRLTGRYHRLLSGSLGYRSITLTVVVVLVVLTGYLFVNTSGQLAPDEDSGALFAVVNAPSYATSEYTNLYALQMRDLTSDLEELDISFSTIGFGGQTNSGFMIWVFKEWGNRDRSQAELQQDIQARISKVAGVEAFVFAPPTLPGSGGGLPISMVLQSTSSADLVYEVAEEIRQQARASGQFIVVQNSLSFDARQVKVTIDRARASALNLSVRDISRTLSLLVGDSAVSQFNRDANSYDIIMQVPEIFRSNPEKLGAFFVRSVDGQMVPLSSVVSVTTTVMPDAIEQFNQLNSATLSALPLPGVTTGDGLAVLQDIARRTIPDGFFLNYSGQSRLEVQEGNTIVVAFVLAIVVIYLVLAAQFESFRDPLIILMSVPLSMFGAIVPLNLGLDTLNIYTQVGLITLIGLITKHGILMVEFANQIRREEGLGRLDGIIRSASVRLRPILMTTAATALGVVPLMLAAGSGAAARFSIGLVIFSGLLIGTLFTLFVVPMFYTFISPAELAKAAERPADEARWQDADTGSSRG